MNKRNTSYFINKILLVLAGFGAGTMFVTIILAISRDDTVPAVTFVVLGMMCILIVVQQWRQIPD